jgi:hypothetical protein
MAMVKGEGKAGFLKEFFVDHPDTDKAAIDEAWQAAGNEGTISGSTIYNVRRDLGLIDKSRGKRRAKAGVRAGRQSSAAAKSEARKPGRKANGRAETQANVRTAAAAVEPAAKVRAKGAGRARTLIELEGQLDEMIYRISSDGALPEFEEALRKARRILIRSHQD